MKVGIIRLYYNEKQAILKTHPKVGATVQYFDGRFPSFEKIGDSDLSTDGSNDAIKSFPDTEIYECPGYITDKLTFAFQKAGKFDAVLLLSCDEWIEGDWEEFCKNVQKMIESGDQRMIYNVNFKVISGDPRINMIAKPRLFVDPASFSVQETHWKYHYKNGPCYSAVSSIKSDIEGITIMHDNRVRPEWRDNLMTKYQQQMPPAQRDAFIDPTKPKPGQYRTNNEF